MLILDSPLFRLPRWEFFIFALTVDINAIQKSVRRHFSAASSPFLEGTTPGRRHCLYVSFGLYVFIICFIFLRALVDKFSLWTLKAQKPQFPFHKTLFGLKFSKLFYQNSSKSRAWWKEELNTFVCSAFLFWFGYTDTFVPWRNSGTN